MSGAGDKISILKKLNKYTILVGLVTGVITVLSSLSYSIISVTISRENEPVDLAKRIEIASENLRNTSSELDLIQRELEKRIEFVEKLNEEAKNAEAMINLSKEQVDAIRSTLNTELNKNNTRNFWTTFSMSFFFLILGSAITIIIPKLIERLKFRKQKDSD
jgi:Holliday junction resolvase-like predicted endonuclease